MQTHNVNNDSSHSEHFIPEKISICIALHYNYSIHPLRVRMCTFQIALSIALSMHIFYQLALIEKRMLHKSVKNREISCQIDTVEFHGRVNELSTSNPGCID
jgi:hypothetical protein